MGRYQLGESHWSGVLHETTEEWRHVQARQSGMGIHLQIDWTSWIGYILLVGENCQWCGRAFSLAIHAISWCIWLARKDIIFIACKATNDMIIHSATTF
jgi:hypothetical protein